MTEADAGSATLAERIASRGRDALVERLRKAYADAAAAHSDIVTLDDARIEAMVQSAADRADGLQWRRALANVASEQLGISLAEALTLPAVAQAQEIVGAPSYEASLAELVTRPVPPAVPAPAVAPVAAPVSAAPVAVAPVAPVPVAEPAPVLEAAPVVEPEPIAAAEPVAEPEPELLPAPEPEHLEPVQADETWVELLPEPAPIEQEPELLPAPEPEPAQPELMIDEPELHGATGELDMVEADDAIFELMPPPEPIEYETESYEAIPDEVEAEAPPILEQVPYEPDFDDTSIAPAAAMAEFSGEPGATDYTGQPTQAHSLLDEAPEFTGPLAEGVLAAEPVPGEQSYADAHGEEYGGEHTVYPPPEDEELQVTAYHLGGVANLPAGRHSLELRLSESGLDILQPEGDIIGRLHWNEIDALEVSAVKARLRRSARTQARILVRTKHGDASFEIPGISSEELEARVEPLSSRYSVSS